MPNPWFQFKQFRVAQDKCAMKVSTDACIQGAWAAAALTHLMVIDEHSRLLDIGTGTGLLSLMLAQAYPQAQLDAIELNEGAAAQAAENFQASPGAARLHVLHTPLSDFKSPPAHYDFIICNPPFFHNQLGSEQQARHDARHSTALNKESLARSLDALLKPNGLSCIMYPLSEWNDWLATAARQGLHPGLVLSVQPRQGAAINRMIGFFGRQQKVCTAESLTIYEQDGTYTPAFRQLLQPYYLAL